jgi:predicted RNA-binding Zn-ribbon protein involved in translation (DUF1610 family)
MFIGSSYGFETVPNVITANMRQLGHRLDNLKAIAYGIFCAALFWIVLLLVREPLLYALYRCLARIGIPSAMRALQSRRGGGCFEISTTAPPQWAIYLEQQCVPYFIVLASLFIAILIYNWFAFGESCTSHCLGCGTLLRNLEVAACPTCGLTLVSQVSKSDLLNISVSSPHLRALTNKVLCVLLGAVAGTIVYWLTGFGWIQNSLILALYQICDALGISDCRDALEIIRSHGANTLLHWEAAPIMLFWIELYVGPVLRFSLSAAVAIASYKGLKRTPDGSPSCTKCGYSLVGLTVPRCPECGTRI